MVTDKTIIKHIELSKGSIHVGNSNHQWMPKMLEYTELGLFDIIPDNRQDRTRFVVTEKGKLFFEFISL
jgi:hypothetical protein